MSIDEIKELVKDLRRNPKKLWPYIIIGLLCFALGAFATGFFNEMGRQLANSSEGSRSLTMDMPLDNKNNYTPINMKNDVGGRLVGVYESADTVVVNTAQSGSSSSYSLTPIKKNE